MTDFTLTPRSAFGATEPQVIAQGTATLRERMGVALASVAARAGSGPAATDALAALVGAPCPISGYVRGPGTSLFWTGPGQWFVLSDSDPEEQLTSRLRSELGATASITGQGDGWVVFDLTGDDVGAVLERLCNIDLSAFGPGRAQRSVVEHIPCFVLCAAPGRSYRLLCGRSYAASFTHAMGLAMDTAAALARRG